MSATITKTAEFMPQGCALRPTEIDAAKAAADFRILDVSCRLKVIAWRDGTRQRVTARELAKLQASHTWQTDF